MGPTSRRQLWVLVLALLALASCSLYVVTVGNNSESRHDFAVKLPEPVYKESQSDIQKDRRKLVQKVCDYLWIESNTSDMNRKTLDHIIVDDEHHLLYCYVPKVACTNWKRVLMILNGNAHDTHPLDIPANNSHGQHVFRTLDTYGTTEITYRLKHYLKFMFVRHPFERLVSAFRNKFQMNYSTYFQNRFGRQIIYRYRPNASKESLLKGHDVKFEEFVNYLVDTNTVNDGPLNEHWRPAFDLCHPCKIKYDFVGKYETIESDADYILDKVGVGGFVSFPRINKTVNTFQLMKELFQTLSKRDAFRLYQLYALDFKMFDYHFNDFDKYLPD